MTTENEISSHFKKAIGPNLISIYRTGIEDDSLLCDIDLILVVKNKKNIKQIYKKGKTNFDIRAIFTPEEFLQEESFLPYVSLKLLWGKSLSKKNISEEKNLKIVKLATMFLYAFQRNFYRDLGKTNIKTSLIHLNDFEYAKYWGYTSVKFESFLRKIRIARIEYPNIRYDRVRELTHEGVDIAWEIVEYLNTELSLYTTELVQENIHPKTLREPTIFCDLDVKTCREQTEALNTLARRAKKIALPNSFKKLLCAPVNSFTYNYVSKNATVSTQKPIPKLKHRIKMLL